MRRFLFKPQPAVAQRVRPAANTVLAMAPEALKVGVHLRLGDAEMAGGLWAGLLHTAPYHVSLPGWELHQPKALNNVAGRKVFDGTCFIEVASELPLLMHSTRRLGQGINFVVHISKARHAPYIGK